MENKFKIGQKVMITEPVREEDRFRVGTVVGFHCASNNYYVQFDKKEAPNRWHASRLTLLPEILQGKTQEEAERTVKALARAVEAILAMGRACKEHTEERLKASEAFKQEADKDKRIAELEQQVEALKQELIERPIVIMPKEAKVSIRLDKPMPEYKEL